MKLYIHNLKLVDFPQASYDLAEEVIERMFDDNSCDSDDEYTTTDSDIDTDSSCELISPTADSDDYGENEDECNVMPPSLPHECDQRHLQPHECEGEEGKWREELEHTPTPTGPNCELRTSIEEVRSRAFDYNNGIDCIGIESVGSIGSTAICGRGNSNSDRGDCILTCMDRTLHDSMGNIDNIDTTNNDNIDTDSVEFDETQPDQRQRLVDITQQMQMDIFRRCIPSAYAIADGLYRADRHRPTHNYAMQHRALFDVILGEGPAQRCNIGNQLLLEHLQDMKRIWRGIWPSEDGDRREYASRMVQWVYRRGGRFLKFAPSSSDGGGDGGDGDDIGDRDVGRGIATQPSTSASTLVLVSDTDACREVHHILMMRDGVDADNDKSNDDGCDGRDDSVGNHNGSTLDGEETDHNKGKSDCCVAAPRFAVRRQVIVPTKKDGVWLVQDEEARKRNELVVHGVDAMSANRNMIGLLDAALVMAYENEGQRLMAGP